MEKLEIYFIVGIAVLTVLCIVSEILILVLGGGKAAKIIFCVVAVLSLCMSVFLALVWMGAVKFDALKLDELKNTISSVLVVVLIIVSSCGIACMAFKKDKKEETLAVLTEEANEHVSYQLTDNVRIAGKRKHGDYTIVETGE